MGYVHIIRPNIMPRKQDITGQTHCLSPTIHPHSTESTFFIHSLTQQSVRQSHLIAGRFGLLYIIICHMHKSIPRFANVRSSIVEGVYKNWKMIWSLNFVSIHVSLSWFVWQQADLSVHGAPEIDQTKVKWKQIKIPLLAQYMHPCIVCSNTHRRRMRRWTRSCVIFRRRINST